MRFSTGILVGVAVAMFGCGKGAVEKSALVGGAVPQHGFTRMYALTVSFCFKGEASQCQPLDPLRLTFAYGADCEIARGNIVTSYERDPAFTLTKPATCERVAKIVKVYPSSQDVEGAFDEPDFLGASD